MILVDGVDGWHKVVSTFETTVCEMCEEEYICPICGIHWADCPHPSPDMPEDEYEYDDTGEFARLIDYEEEAD